MALLWLWALPVALLLLLNFQGYQLIHENMDVSQLVTAHHIGLAGLFNLGLGLALAVLAARLRSTPGSALAAADWFIPLAAILTQIGYLWFVISTGDDAIPLNVAVWIFPPGRFLFTQFSFAMLPLAHGVLRLAVLRPAVRPHHSAAIGIGSVIAAPVLIYLLFLLLDRLNSPSSVAAVFMITAVTLLSVVLFAALTRALLAGLHLFRSWSAHAELFAIVFVAFCLPLGGLLLNRDIDFPVDFQAWEVYALVAVNTVALLFASLQHRRRPLLSFGLLCATFPFSLYFFIVFLPYTPLALLAIIACGLGFLILSPTLLFVLHLHLLHRAFRSSRLADRPGRTTLTGVLCVMLLPAFFAGRALADRTALHAALDYVYEPALNTATPTYAHNLAHLRRALASHRSYKNGIYYPLLSDFYAWAVFDHLVLPDDKIARIEQTFFGETGSTVNSDPIRSRRGGFSSERSVRSQTRMPRATPPTRDVAVTDLALRTDPAGDHATTATLTLTLVNFHALDAEYLARLPLPPGVFVTGFRLSVNGTLVPGRIFEKKTALWVYTMIRDSERRDPGLLFYRTPDELELRVYPVSIGTPVRVELDFLVPAPPSVLHSSTGASDPAALLAQFACNLPVQLAITPAGTFATPGSTPLPAVEREPYLHLIVDRSLANSYAGDLNSAIRTLREKFPAACTARVTLANYDVSDLQASRVPLAELTAVRATRFDTVLPSGGSLALDLALAHAIRQHRDTDLDQPPAGPAPQPVFVILSHHAAARSLDNLDRTAAWSDLLPGLELHELGDDGSWLDHVTPPVSHAPLLRLGSSQRPLSSGHALHFAPVTAHSAVPLEFWSPEIGGWRAVPGVTTRPATDLWSRAVELQLSQHDQARSPGDSALDLPALVRASRETGILTSATSYIVVENAAQWRMLEKSERQKLGQNIALEFRETPAPSWLLIAPLFLLWLFHRARKPQRLFIAPAQ